MARSSTTPTRAQLAHRVAILESQDISRLSAAYHEAPKAARSRHMASGVVISLTSLSGQMIMPPTCVGDGLSPETIEALQADIARALRLRIDANPVPKPD